MTHAELFTVLWDWLDEADRISNANSHDTTMRPREVFARALVNVQAKASSGASSTVARAPGHQSVQNQGGPRDFRD